MSTGFRLRQLVDLHMSHGYWKKPYIFCLHLSIIFAFLDTGNVRKVGSLFCKFFFPCLNFHSPVWLIKLDRWLILQLAVSLWVELWCVLSREVVCVIVRLWNPSDVQILAIIHGRLRIRLQDVSIIGSNIWACNKLQRNRHTDWMIFLSSCFF